MCIQFNMYFFLFLQASFTKSKTREVKDYELYWTQKKQQPAKNVGWSSF